MRPKVLFAAVVAAALLASLTGCVTVSEPKAAEPSTSSKAVFDEACAAFSEFTEAYLSADFALAKARASVAADAFEQVVPEDAQAAGFAQVMQSFVWNDGKYSDNTSAYNKLLNFCE